MEAGGLEDRMLILSPFDNSVMREGATNWASKQRRITNAPDIHGLKKLAE
ncbi:MAG: hypothetical protein ACI87W_003057 [Halieaceae bacterium]|jgi:hypothetical protein